MSKSKSKLGQNPLATRGVGALFPEDSAPGSVAVAPPQKASLKRSKAKSVSNLVNKITNTDTADEPLERHTFYLTDSQVQKIKLYALLHRKAISEVVRTLIDNHIKIQP